MKKIGVLFLALALVLQPLSGVKVGAADGNKVYSVELCGGNGPVTSIENAHKMELNSTVEATIKSIGQEVEGSDSLSYSGDLATAFEFTTAPGNTYYEFTYSNPYFKNSVNFTLYDQNKMKTSFQNASVSVGQSSSQTFTLKLNPNQKYYVVVSLSNSDGIEEANVSVSVKTLADAAGDTKETATAIDLGTTLSAALDGAADIDFYTFTTTKDKAFYKVDVIDVSVSSLNFVLYDANLQELQRLSCSANSTQTIYLSLNPTTTYYFKLDSSNNDDIGNYNVLITQLTDDINDTASTAYGITVGTGYDYELQCDMDADAFKFTPEHTSATVSLTNNSDNDSLSLMLLDSNGNQVTSSSTQARGTALLNKSDYAVGSTYYVVVSGLSGTKYNLRVDYDVQSITYELNKGTNSENNPEFFFLGDTVSLENPTRDGYDFVGWYTSPEMEEGYEFKGISATDKEAVTVYAKWQKATAAAPSNVKIKKLKKNKVKISFTKGKDAKGTEISYSLKKNMSGAKTVKITGKTTTLKNFVYGKTYYVQLRSYKKSGKKTVWSKKIVYKVLIKK